MMKANAYYHGEEWGIPDVPPTGPDPTFLFVFTPPYTGSTALSGILSTARSSATLTPNAEGQWLIRGLSKGDRWNPEKAVNWQSVRAIWTHRLQMIESVTGPVDLVIEKSPPHMVRFEALLEQFPRHRLIAFNRNPYAYCASSLHHTLGTGPESPNDRMDDLNRAASAWVTRSTYVRRIVERYRPVFFTYEDFCSDPKATINRATESIPELRGVSVRTKVKVKQYAPQKITNHNSRQIALLSEAERSAIGQTLSDHEELLNFFSYTSDWKKDIEEGGAGNVERPVHDRPRRAVGAILDRKE